MNLFWIPAGHLFEATKYAFAALRGDGRVFTWGETWRNRIAMVREGSKGSVKKF